MSLPDAPTPRQNPTQASTARLLRQHFAADPALQQRFNALKKRIGTIRPSQYDLSDRCNLRCEGCLYFAGQASNDVTTTDAPDQVDAFFTREAARGINYLQIAGAEPALEPDKLAIAAHHIPRGVVFTNGSIRIDPRLPFRVHISLWGLPDESAKFRGADIVRKALRNYAGDDRAIFVLTINSQNLPSIRDIVQLCADHQVRITFSHYSPTSEYLSATSAAASGSDYFRLLRNNESLLLSREDLRRTQDTIDDLIETHAGTVVYSHAFNRWIHNPQGLYTLDPRNGWATDCGSRTTRSYRHFYADLSDAGDVKCCAPNIDCAHCRLYAQSWATLLQRFPEFVRTRDGLAQWIDFWDLWSRLFLLATP